MARRASSGEKQVIRTPNNGPRHMSGPLLPKMYLLRQNFPRPVVIDIPGAVQSAIASLNPGDTIRSGDSVAIGAGSRGIRHIDTITKTVVEVMKDLGARPFIFPAMGSHGGGTAEGQKRLLAGYGITEEAMGCEIRSSMDVVTVGCTSLGTMVYLDRHAAGADHIAVVNRIKPHTRLIGPVESGLLKMCLIGFGKREGARTYHRAIDRHSWKEVVESVTGELFSKTPIVFGLAILQNAHEEIARIEAVKPRDFLTREPVLLEEARGMMGCLPFRDTDLLIVDEMGKEISGTGMDTNITGRKEGSPMKVARVFVRNLTKNSRGNALGIGLADYTTRRLVDSIDYHALYINSQTAYRTDACMIPMTFDTDQEAIRVAMEMAGAEFPEEYKILWVKNTLELESVMVSEAYRERFGEVGIINSVVGPEEIHFDIQGNLVNPF